MAPSTTKSGVQVKAVNAKIQFQRSIHILRRVIILGAAICYIYRSFQAAARSIMVLRGAVDHSMTFVPYVSPLIPAYVGTSTILQSRLVVEVLGNVTTPRRDSLYLVSETTARFDGCGSAGVQPNSWTYNNTYMRQNLAELVDDTSYNLTFLSEIELILPVVDCTSGAITFADDSATRVFYLMRSKRNHADVGILTWSLSTQDYRLPEEHQVGATASITLTFINDLQTSEVTYHHVMRLGFPYQLSKYQPYHFVQLNSEGFWVLESVPHINKNEAAMVVLTACRTGFYVNAESEQSNAKNLNWKRAQDPMQAMSVWAWSGYTTVRDSWGWVHGIHIIFAVSTTFNLCVLVLVIYQNARQKKIWVGDAFVSVSSTLMIRAGLVLLSWYVNDFWTLMEFCLQESNELTDVQHVFAYPTIIHADLLALYLGLAGVLGNLLRERIDPALALFLFEVGFAHRLSIAKMFSTTLDVATTYAKYDYLQGLSAMEPKYKALSPMRLWTTHGLVKKDAAFIFVTLFASFVSFILLVAHTPLRKLYRHYYPNRPTILSRMTGASTGAEALLSWKSSLTIFEVATGAPLQNRVGLVSDYENCIYIKGMKFASADGVYCNGYVIVSGKWLVSTDDLPIIIAMVLTRVRFKNIYVYEVNGFTVQQTARLVYPETMSLRDLVHLNVSILS